MVKTVAEAAAGSNGATVGIGIDSTSVNSASSYGSVTNNGTTPSECTYDDIPSIGFHQFNWLEISGGATITFIGTAGQPTYFQFGMTGRIGC